MPKVSRRKKYRPATTVYNRPPIEARTGVSGSKANDTDRPVSRGSSAIERIARIGRWIEKVPTRLAGPNSPSSVARSAERQPHSSPHGHSASLVWLSPGTKIHLPTISQDYQGYIHAAHSSFDSRQDNLLLEVVEGIARKTPDKYTLCFDDENSLDSRQLTMQMVDEYPQMARVHHQEGRNYSGYTMAHLESWLVINRRLLPWSEQQWSNVHSWTYSHFDAPEDAIRQALEHDLRVRGPNTNQRPHMYEHGESGKRYRIWYLLPHALPSKRYYEMYEVVDCSLSDKSRAWRVSFFCSRIED